MTAQVDFRKRAALGLLPGRLREMTPFQLVSALVILLGILAVMYPVFLMARELLMTEGELDTSAFEQFKNSPGAVDSILDTTLVVALGAAGALVIGGLIAYFNERTDARMGAVTDLLPFLPFLIPGLAGAIGWVLLLAPQAGFVNVIIRDVAGMFGYEMTEGPFDIYSYPGLIFLYTIYLVPFAFLLISAGLRNIDSQQEEQSRVCGASRLRTFRKVVIPAVGPSIAAALMLVVWHGFGMYSAPVTIGPSAHINIMSVEIVSMLTLTFPAKYGAAILLSLIMVSFVGLAWYVQTRVLRRGRHSMTGGRARQSPRSALGVWKWPIRTGMMLYISAVTVLPVCALVLVTLNGFWSPDIRWDQLSLAPLRKAVFEDPATLEALKNSAGLALSGATVSMVLAAIVSVFVVNSRGRLVRFADGTLKLPVIVSHVVLAIGFVLAFAGPPFRLGGTWLILLLAYVAFFMPQGTVTTDALAAQVGRDLSDASKTSGARDVRTFRKIFFPLMLPGIASGWALLFVFILGDLEVSSLLAGPNNPTIGKQTLVYYTEGSYAEVASLALMLSVVTSIVVGTVLISARRRSAHGLGVAGPGQ
jgi:iron(III) transport system permease protein